MYEEALRRGRVSCGELCKSVGLPEAVVKNAFMRLRELGMLQPAEQRPGFYVCRSPDVAEALALGPLRRELQDTKEVLSRASAAFTVLREVYETAGREAREADGVVLAVDPADVNALLDQAASECRTDLITAQPGGSRPVEILAEAQSRDLAMLEKGVRMRTLYQHSARFDPATEAYAERLMRSGAEFRTLHTLFPRLIIFDRQVAFVPTRDGASAVCLRQPDLVAFLLSTFETAWQAAMPFASAYETRRQKYVVSDTQQAITRLLLLEDKDASIARRLGISERACRQHIAKLMARFGARNRTHLGYLLATEAQPAEGREVAR
ncbi:LuxR C-terminal-related transcriptional regulator [Streptomyces sp. NPDC048718]|uniref:LuxR C-terminal-related transcriptional regulator n=1 Tax=Streptomyces sp. NPDC048718 TaxID=3365587 RepID=UPI003710F8A1